MHAIKMAFVHSPLRVIVLLMLMAVVTAFSGVVAFGQREGKVRLMGARHKESR